LIEAEEDNLKAHLGEIKDVHRFLTRSRTEYDFQLPTLVSHAPDYAHDLARLRRYAREVVNGRIMQLLAVTFMKSWFLVDLYLMGLERRNPYSLFLATRTQMEIFAVTWDTAETIRQNAGDEGDRFAERVKTIDEALINATYGTRSALILDLLPKLEASKLRATRDEDVQTWKARNVLTRLDRLSKSKGYGDCKADYERICEYLHPNIGQNIVLVVSSTKKKQWVKACRTDREPLKRAIRATARPMDQASKGTVQMLASLHPPFAGVAVFPQESRR